MVTKAEARNAVDALARSAIHSAVDHMATMIQTAMDQEDGFIAGMHLNELANHLIADPYVMDTLREYITAEIRDRKARNHD